MPSGLISDESSLPDLQMTDICCVLTWSFLCACALLVSLPLLIMTPFLLDKGPTLMTPFNLNHWLKSPISKYNHIGGLGLQQMNWGGLNTINSITCCNKYLKKLKWLWNWIVGRGWKNFEAHDRKSLDCLE